MASKAVTSLGGGSSAVVQGFRAGPVVGDTSYVYVGVRDSVGEMQGIVLSTEDANILSEYIRQEAEFAGQDAVREKGEE